MSNVYDLGDPKIIEQLKEIWEPKKEYIEKDLWVIRNFLTAEELEFLNKEARDPTGWYPTMRSAYNNNLQNKFIGYIPTYGEDGVLIPPHPKNEPKFDNEKTQIVKIIENKLEAVLPKYFTGAGAFQSLFEVHDNDIRKALGHDADYAMGWHYERDDSDDEIKQKTVVTFTDESGRPPIIVESKITASFNVYINDDFDGGILEFRNKPYKINPEPGMLINIPLSKEFEHRVTKVTNGNRHTLYGRCWDNLNNAHISSREDC